jgi:diguanylate cyclase (GGDEF)-like protein/PAS domain S-box-containing protein
MGPLDGFSQFLDLHPDPAWIHELSSLRLIKVNGALASLTGYSQDELVGMYVTELLTAEEADRLMKTAGEASRGPSRETWKVRNRGGQTVELESSSHTVRIQDQPCRLVIGRLRSGERKGTRVLAKPAQPDTLTVLPGSAEFLERIGRRIMRAREAPERRFAVFMVDLDRFKLMQRSLGLDGANQLLVNVARRLEVLLHPDEILARLEGDRFAILLENVTNAETALHMAREIQEEIEAPVTISGQELQVTAGVGVALGSPDPGAPADMLKNAEFALNEAKTQGPGGHQVYAPEMQARAAKDLRMEVDLRPGIESGDLKVLFQPIVSLRTGLLAGFEALARWQHPELGLIMPGQFISMAERTGIIVDLGKQVMRDACRQVCEWQTRFRNDPPLFVTVNCSAAQFADPKLATIVKWSLANSGLPPKSLKLELTESVLMEESPRTARALDRILELGVHLIIDDFGTGYSSLSRLHQLPIEALKIDRSFVSGLVDRPDSLTVTRAIIQMARSFAMKVTAEGIENADQLAALRRLDCDYGQGYYFSPAVGQEAAEQLLASNKKW